ncbi:MAG TPA: hypothetical protein VH054_02780, partial [Polyangiaceae bacterium]|nr:hypothetical protein [Polyangiaceae bacterium]
MIRFACVVGALVMLVWTGRVRADDDVVPRTLVRVVIASDESQATALEGSLRPMLSRLQLALETKRAERVDLDDAAALAVPSNDALVTAWVDLRSTGHATVVLVDGAGHVVERRVVPSEGSAAIAIEGVAQIVYASSEDIVVRRPHPHVELPAISISVEPPALEPRERPIPTAPRASRVLFDAGAFVSTTTFGEGAPIVVGGGLSATLAAGRSSLHPSLRASVSVDVPFDVSGPLVALDTNVLSARLAPAIRVANGSSWFVEAAAEGGVDVMWVSPRGTGLPVGTVRDPTTNASPIVGALVALHLRAGSRAAFRVAL